MGGHDDLSLNSEIPPDTDRNIYTCRQRRRREYDESFENRYYRQVSSRNMHVMLITFNHCYPPSPLCDHSLTIHGNMVEP